MQKQNKGAIILWLLGVSSFGYPQEEIQVPDLQINKWNPLTWLILPLFILVVSIQYVIRDGALDVFSEKIDPQYVKASRLEYLKNKFK